MKKACMRIGDAVWTLSYDIGKDNTANILDFNCEDSDGYVFESTLSKLDFIKESADGLRTAVEVSIDGVPHVVKNQQSIFSYKAPL